jgi:hypothetical protein
MFIKFGNDRLLRPFAQTGRTVQMQNMPSEHAFEVVARDMSVTADGKPEKSRTNTRVGYSLRRLFEPVTDEQ